MFSAQEVILTRKKSFYRLKNVFVLLLTFGIALSSIGQATLPHSRTAWGSEPTGWTNSGCSQRTTTSACTGSDATIFDFTGDSRTLFIASAPNQLTFKLKNQSMSGESSLLVEESPDNSSWTTLGRYGTATGATAISNCSDITLSLNCATRYIRWTYTKATGNCDMDDVSVTAGSPCITCSPDTEPTVNASNIVVTPACNSVDITFTSGNGSNVIILMSETCPISDIPVDQTSYTAGIYSYGSTIGAGNYVVYNGPSNSITISGLVVSTSYCFKIFEYNGSTADCDENYLTTGVLETSFTTLNTGCLQSVEPGIIVNEASNGDSGNREYMELLVVGTPCGVADLRGWIVDDNNGLDGLPCEGFGVATSNSGLASGHVRFKNIARWQAVPVGSIILLYNNAAGDKNLAITLADDPTDSNGDNVYVVPISDSGLEEASVLPSALTLDCSYSPSTYSNTTTASWGLISLRNGGDAAQTRRPDGSYYHGISYGPTTQMTGGINGLQVTTSTGAGTVLYLNCGYHRDVANYSAGDGDMSDGSSEETPGLPNNALNQKYVDYFLHCTADPCIVLLSSNSIRLEGKNENKTNVLTWHTLDNDIDYFTVYKSENNFDYMPVKEVKNNNANKYNFTDKAIAKLTYYKIEAHAYSGALLTSNIVSLKDLNHGESFFISDIYPNPANNSYSFNLQIKDRNQEITLDIYNVIGEKVQSHLYNESQNVTLQSSDLSNGIYHLIFHSENNIQSVKLIVEH